MSAPPRNMPRVVPARRGRGFAAAWLLRLVPTALALVAIFAGCRGPQPGEATSPVLPGAVEAHEPSPPQQALAAQGWPRTFTDDLGEQVTLAHPARRVVSVAPNLTEIVYFIGAGDRLVGRTDFCDYPPEVKHKPSIGGVVTPSLEKVLALYPDLVLVARGTDLYFIQRLRRQGLPVFASDPKSLDDVFELILAIGRMLGQDTVAARKVSELRARVKSMSKEVPIEHPQPRALAIISLDPVFVAGGGSFLDDLLRRAGFQNAASEDKPWVQWGAERILAADPDLLIYVSQSGDDKEALAAFLHPPWSGLKAVAESRIYAVREDLVTIPGPRLVEGLQKLILIRHQATAALSFDHQQPGPDEDDDSD
ncbi:MAG: ABC transporter substrate-binding protein [Armatimonadetes bacterium]|nr:ABC transporter substrate-binding protein [Armatimonadota bacterium]